MIFPLQGSRAWLRLSSKRHNESHKSLMCGIIAEPSAFGVPCARPRLRHSGCLVASATAARLRRECNLSGALHWSATVHAQAPCKTKVSSSASAGQSSCPALALDCNFSGYVSQDWIVIVGYFNLAQNYLSFCLRSPNHFVLIATMQPHRTHVSRLADLIPQGLLPI